MKLRMISLFSMIVLIMGVGIFPAKAQETVDKPKCVESFVEVGGIITKVKLVACNDFKRYEIDHYCEAIAADRSLNLIVGWEGASVSLVRLPTEDRYVITFTGEVPPIDTIVVGLLVPAHTGDGMGEEAIPATVAANLQSAECTVYGG